MNILNLSDARRRTPPLDAEEIQNCTARLQAAVFDALSEADVSEIVKAQVKKAKEGNSAAARTVFALVAAAARITDQESQRKPPPPRPVDALPGSIAKVDAMAERAANRQPLCVNGDGHKEAQESP